MPRNEKTHLFCIKHIYNFVFKIGAGRYSPIAYPQLTLFVLKVCIEAKINEMIFEWACLWLLQRVLQSQWLW